MKKSGVAVVKEINDLATSGDPSNDMVMEQIRAILVENSHLLEDKK